MIRTVQKMVNAADAALAGGYLSAFCERNAVIILLFHSLFRSHADVALNHIDPLQQTTVEHFKSAIEYYQQQDYRFIGSDDLLQGLDPDGRYVQITFDDGYYNNSLALPVLEHYQVPATFFISVDHVLQRKCFWWDVLFRERLARGVSRASVYAEAIRLKRYTTEYIEDYLLTEFGSSALKPRGDIDRPFTPTELSQFAVHERVHIGNHTKNHAILTNYDDSSLREQIHYAQDAIANMTGTLPASIAYPNGGCDERVIRACREAGLSLGYTVVPQKISIPAIDSFRLGRFAPSSTSSIESQCRTYRSDVSFYRSCRSMYLNLFRSGMSA